ncbi:hypothetical protein Rsub_09066 [Raphidocelis subcapitata]|uniref:Uncharacterized protein n=1 Tax=Raphidocelis subcapitata TaxID=307507 RepID=A0A2V0P8T0_9CHLO|nr:hypothetical protein Rsub_09066 [Raphidocelis subcapitata]|eukprot:GBF96271.1 hypothetical protein Rsub_09066 [Raphidocelis subcapitata]
MAGPVRGLWSIRKAPEVTPPPRQLSQLQSIRHAAAVQSTVAVPPQRGGGGAAAAPPPPQRPQPDEPLPPPQPARGGPQRGPRGPLAYLGGTQGPGDAPSGSGPRQLLARWQQAQGPQQAPAQGWQALGSPPAGAPPAAPKGLSRPEAAEAAAAAGRLVSELHAAARAAAARDGGGAAAAPPDPARWRSSVELLRPQLAALNADELANLAWALSRLGLRPDDSWLSELAGAARAAFGLRRFRGYTYATLLPALAALGAPPGDEWLSDCLRSMVPKLGKMWPRELSSIAAALPQLLRGTPAAAARGGGGGAGASGAARLLADSGWAPAFFEASAPQLPRFEPIAASRALRAVASLAAEFGARPPPGWLAGALRRLALAARAGDLRPPEAAATLQALVLLRRSLPLARGLALQGGAAGAAAEAGAAAAAETPLPTAADTAHTADSAAGTAGDTEPDTAAEAEAQALALELQNALGQQLAANAERFGPRELPSALMALAELGARPDWLWLQRTLTAAQAQLPGCSPRQLSTLLSAAARLVRACPSAQPRVWDQALLVLQDAERMAAAQQPHGPRGAARQRERAAAAPAADSLAAAAAAGGDDRDGRPGASGRAFVVRWARAVCAAALPQLGRFSAEDVAATAGALASLRVVPPPLWYEALLQVARQRLVEGGGGDGGGDGCDGAAAARTAVALARLSLLPSPTDADVALQPADEWLAELYASAAARSAPGPHPRAAPHPEGGDSGPAAPVGGPPIDGVIQLMWAAGVFGWHPGDAWWAWAEGRVLEATVAAFAGGAGAGTLPARSAVALLQAYGSARRAPPGPLLAAAALSPAARARLVAAGPGAVTAALRAVARMEGPPAPPAPPSPPQPARKERGAETQQQNQEPAPLRGLLRPQRPQQPQQQAAPERQAPQQLPQGPQHPQPPSELRAFVAALAADLQSRLEGMHARDLAALAAAFAAARLDASDAPGWRDALLRATAPRLRACRPRELARLLWAAAASDLKPPPAWIEAALAALRDAFPAASPRALAAALRALTALGYRPSADWLGAFLLAAQRKLPDADAPSLVDLIHSLADLQARPGGRWLRPVLVALHPRLGALPPRGLALLLGGLVRMSVRPSHAYVASVLAALLAAAEPQGGGDGGDAQAGAAGGRLERADDAHLVAGLSAAARLGWRPDAAPLPRGAAGALWRATAARLPGMADAHFVTLLSALARLDGRPQPPLAWRAAVAREALRRAGRLPAAGLARAVWACGRLGVPLQQGGDAAASDALLARALELRGDFTAPQLLRLLAGAARARLRPGQAWLSAIAGAPALARPSALAGGALVPLAAAFAALGYAPPRGWVDALDTLTQVAHAEGAGMAATRAWALARLREGAACRERGGGGGESGGGEAP